MNSHLSSLLGLLDQGFCTKIFLIHGTHGNEAKGSRLIASYISNSLHELLPTSSIEPIGPIEEWSSTHGFRFTNNLEDPNRIIDNVYYSASSHRIFSKLWTEQCPSDVRSMSLFLDSLHGSGVALNHVISIPQNLHPGIPGYCTYSSALARSKRITDTILSSLNNKLPLKLILIDIHVGVGSYALTTINHFWSSLLPNSYLIDIVCSDLERNLPHSSIHGLILETGVESNLIGALDLLTELAERTHGYTSTRHLLERQITDEWSNQSKNYIEQALTA